MVSCYPPRPFPLHGALGFCAPSAFQPVHPLCLSAPLPCARSLSSYFSLFIRAYLLFSFSSEEITVFSPPPSGRGTDGIAALPDSHAAAPGFYCASCGYSQKPNARHKTITPAAVAVAVCIHKDFIRHYDPVAGSIKACRSCHEVANKALRLTRFAFPSAAAFNDSKHTGKAAEERPAAIAIGGRRCAAPATACASACRACCASTATPGRTR